MTENEERLEELKDAICRLVSIAEDAICREGFEELDNAGAEIIGYLEEIQEYKAIGTVEEFKALKEKDEPKKTNGFSGCICNNIEMDWDFMK